MRTRGEDEAARCSVFSRQGLGEANGPWGDLRPGQTPGSSGCRRVPCRSGTWSL